MQNWHCYVKKWRHDEKERRQHLTAESSFFRQWKQLIYLKLDWRYWIVIYQKITNSKNDWWYRQISSRQRKAIGFETIFLKNMSNKKTIKSHKVLRQKKSSSTRGIKTKKLHRDGGQFYSPGLHSWCTFRY